MKEIRCGICYSLMKTIDDGEDRTVIEYSYDGCEKIDTMWHYTHR